MKKILIVIIFAIIILFSSCTSENLEGLSEFEGIYHPVSFGYNIDLKLGDTIYAAYAPATGMDETYADLDSPQGDKIGFFKTNADFKNEIYYIYEVAGYSSDEWLYMFIGSDGSRGISLYKSENVTDIPNDFLALREPYADFYYAEGTYNSEEENETDNFREFTIEGRYDISEIRINVNVAGHEAIKAENNLITLGFINLNEPINQNSEFLVRYTDAETRELVEFYGNDMERYVLSDDLNNLLAKAEEYRLIHTGQAIVFDRYGNISVINAEDKVLHSGGYLWGGHTLAVVILDLEAPAPRHASRNFLFFPDNEEFMQGSSCKRIIIREKIQSREHGSIEFMFGDRCPDSRQPLTEEDCDKCP